MAAPQYLSVVGFGGPVADTERVTRRFVETKGAVRRVRSGGSREVTSLSGDEVIDHIDRSTKIAAIKSIHYSSEKGSEWAEEHPPWYDCHV